MNLQVLNRSFFFLTQAVHLLGTLGILVGTLPSPHDTYSNLSLYHVCDSYISIFKPNVWLKYTPDPTVENYHVVDSIIVNAPFQ